MSKLETSRITIARFLTEDGQDLHSVKATSGMSLVEALGLLRLAEVTLIDFPPAKDDDESENG